MRIEYRHFQTCKLSRESPLLCNLFQKAKQTRGEAGKIKTEGQENRAPSTGARQAAPREEGEGGPRMAEGQVGEQPGQGGAGQQERGFQGGEKRTNRFDHRSYVGGQGVYKDLQPW